VLITTPMKPLELMIGKIVPYIFIGLLQISIILLLGHVVFEVPINGSLAPVYAATLLLFYCREFNLGLVDFDGG